MNEIELQYLYRPNDPNDKRVRCHHVLKPDKKHPYPWQCPQIATNWSISRGEYRCHGHGGEKPEDFPQAPEFPELRGEMARIDRVLEEFDKMTAEQRFNLDRLKMLNDLSRTKGVLFNQWRLSEKIREEMKNYVLQERAWFIDKINGVIRHVVRDPKEKHRIADEFTKVIEEGNLRPPKVKKA